MTLACINCNEWLEKACTDCAGRPETPYEVYWREFLVRFYEVTTIMLLLVLTLITIKHSAFDTPPLFFLRDLISVGTLSKPVLLGDIHAILIP